MRKAARQHDDVCALQRCFLVPDELGVLAKDVFRGVIGVVIAVGTRKDDDAEFHFLLCGGAPPPLPASARSSLAPVNRGIVPPGASAEIASFSGPSVNHDLETRNRQLETTRFQPCNFQSP